MKKAVLVFVVAALVLMTTALWVYSSEGSFKGMDILQFGVILLVVIFALFIGFKRLKSVKRGEPVEDELSKKVLQKTSSLSYYISLYLWVGMIFINDRFKIETEELIGMGILGMALTFAICWLVFNFRGVKNE
jgi:peptidoglycan/LPS O-acetylase OafA/YrhL